MSFCKRCGGWCITVSEGGDGYTRHTAACLDATACEYERKAEQAKRVNTHDRPFYQRAAKEHRRAAHYAARMADALNDIGFGLYHLTAGEWSDAMHSFERAEAP